MMARICSCDAACGPSSSSAHDRAARCSAPPPVRRTRSRLRPRARPVAGDGADVPRGASRSAPPASARPPARRAIGDAPERDAEARRRVADGVERPIVRDDVETVTGRRPSEPHPRRHRDPEIAPIGDAGRGSAVHELRATLRQRPTELLADHPPVADRRELGGAGLDLELVQHAQQIVLAAGVLDVDEDGAARQGDRRRGTAGCRQLGTLLNGFAGLLGRLTRR